MMPKFPPPDDRAYLLLDGKAIPVEEIPPEEWRGYVKIMMKNAGRVMSDYYSAKLCED